MLLFDEIPQPLMIYDALEKQSRFHPEHLCSVFSLKAEYDRLLPFQVRFFEGEVLESIFVISIDGAESYAVDLGQIEVIGVSQYQYYLWPSDGPMRLKNGSFLDLDCAENYYLHIVTNEFEYFSEVFEPIVDIDRYLLIEWYDNHSVDPAYYHDDVGFKFRFYFDTFITKGTPTIIIDSEEDGHGEIIDISRKVNITYDIALGVVPNYIFEAVSFMSIHRMVMVTTPRSLRQGDIKNISIEEEQIDMAPFWSVVINFQQGRYYYNTSCGEGIKPPEVEEYLIDQGMTGNLYDTFIEQQNISE